MASTSTNLGLRKPAGPDVVNVVTDISNNMDTLDGKWVAQLPSQISLGGSPSAGSTLVLARADHVHGGPGFAAPVAVGTLNSEGVASSVSRSDHVHAGTVAPSSPWSHLEAFDLDAGVSEDVRFYVPSVPTNRRLTLRGRLPRAGLLAAHGHGTATSGDQSATHDHGASGNASVGHDHGATGGQSADHSHTIGNDNATHLHGLKGIGGDDPSNTSLDNLAGSQATSNLWIENASPTHSHGGATGGASAGHTHTTGAQSATHTHTSGNASVGHTHQVTVASAGSAGYTAGLRPEGVTVAIDGTDRTTALGGPWGTSGADWNVVDLDVAPYLSTTGWHEIVVAASGGGRLKAHVLGY